MKTKEEFWQYAAEEDRKAGKMANTQSTAIAAATFVRLEMLVEVMIDIRDTLKRRDGR